jgi:hypothetical protein
MAMLKAKACPCTATLMAATGAGMAFESLPKRGTLVTPRFLPKAGSVAWTESTGNFADSVPITLTGHWSYTIKTTTPN